MVTTITINIPLGCQCSNVLLFGITRLRLSRARVENRLYIHPDRVYLQQQQSFQFVMRNDLVK